MTGRKPLEDRSRLIAVELDDVAAGEAAFLAAERATAIRDLLEENVFRPSGRSGSFRLRLAIREGKLVLDITDAGGGPIARHVLSLTPLDRVVKDYFLICESHTAAIRTADPRRIEAIDMGRRGIHNEGAEALGERLKGKVEADFATLRRLFTLVCSLRWKG
jgi:uncharacterized protein (UPF0262 family)